MWQYLLANAGFASTDQIFIVAWGFAIAFYGETFKSLTLVATTGNGLPNLGSGPFTPPGPPESAINFATDCMKPVDMDCQAETTILSFFAESNSGGSNGKATQSSGLEASRIGLSLGIDGVKFLSRATMGLGTPSTRILGGAQCTMSVADNPATEGGLPPILLPLPIKLCTTSSMIISMGRRLMVGSLVGPLARRH